MPAPVPIVPLGPLLCPAGSGRTLPSAFWSFPLIYNVQHVTVTSGRGVDTQESQRSADLQWGGGGVDRAPYVPPRPLKSKKGSTDRGPKNQRRNLWRGGGRPPPRGRAFKRLEGEGSLS